MTKTIAAHLDEPAAQRLKDVAQAENRPVSQIVSVPLRMALQFSPAVRRAMFAIDGTENDAEKAFAAKLVGRAMLKAYEGILDQRHPKIAALTSNSALDSEAKIEAEATRLARP